MKFLNAALMRIGEIIYETEKSDIEHICILKVCTAAVKDSFGLRYAKFCKIYQKNFGENLDMKTFIWKI